MTTSEKAATQATNSNMTPDLLAFAQAQASKIIRHMEATRAAPTLLLDWPKVRLGFISGFVNGVNTGFSIGYKTANKLAEKENPPQPEEQAEAAPAQLVLPL